MATRTIVTSQPDVACDVCERRLLRGEQPDIFLAAGRRRTVCELCAPRAAHEGWMRERDSQSVTLPPMRARRGRSFFERLRQKGISGGREAEAQPGEATQAAPQGGLGSQMRGSYDFLEGATPAAGIASEDPTLAPVPAFPREAGESVDEGSEGHLEAPLDAGTELLVRGLELFNSSEYPRRVAGVSRSLPVI